MPARRLPMRKVKDVLRLHYDSGFSDRKIARSLSVSRPVVKVTLDRFTASGLQWPAAGSLTEADLEARLYPSTPPAAAGARPEPDWKAVKLELTDKHVTRYILWEEYAAANEHALGYSQFCERYRQWLSHVDPVMRIEHKAGEKLFVDYAGDPAEVVDPKTGEVRHAQLFVGVMGASSLLYAEATWTQGLEDWIMSHVRALSFYGGVPEVIVPDNTKTAVTHACYYEPTLNRTYADLAEHYHTAILPTRVRRPKDKAKVEAGVLHAERQILGRLRNRQFFSLAALNEAIAEIVDDINDKRFQKMDASRRSLFDATDAKALRPLPPTAFEYAQWKSCRAGANYHIEIDKHFYSVPHAYMRRRLHVRMTSYVVEIFNRDERIACHTRSYHKHAYTTLADHMPSNHRGYAEWSPKRIEKWAATVGPATMQFCHLLMEARRHPEQGYRACMGVMRLGTRYGNDRLEAACARAVAARAIRYKSVESILNSGLDALPLAQGGPHAPTPTHHEYVRGPEYYT